MAARKWTPEQKAKQSALIHTWQPWQHSTGPKTSEGKAISAMNAHSGYFRRRVQLGQWLLWARYHTDCLTPELIQETKWRADKLNLFSDDELDEYTQHSQFFSDIAIVNVKVAMDEPCEKAIGFYMRAVLIDAAIQIVSGR
jgi:hypothetical protein